MKAKQQLIESWLRIVENTETSMKYGISKRIVGTEIACVLIDFQQFKNALENARNKFQPRDDWDTTIFQAVLTDSIDSSCILGMINLDTPEDPCNGALEVKASAVKQKGMGGLVYSMGYWISPNHSLIADRAMLSQDALNAWEKISQKITGKPLDNVVKPSNNDPNDDCEVWHSDKYVQVKNKYRSSKDSLPTNYANAVNKSYMAQPKFDCESAYKNYMNYITNFCIKNKNMGTGLSVKLIEDAVQDGGIVLFQEKYKLTSMKIQIARGFSYNLILPSGQINVNCVFSFISRIKK